LLVIGVAEVGLEPADAEKNLTTFFALAHKWGCVLLLDEADIFISSRAQGDFKRNALVSGKLTDAPPSAGFLADSRRSSS